MPTFVLADDADRDHHDRGFNGAGLLSPVFSRCQLVGRYRVLLDLGEGAGAPSA
jgi:hypothetical protein